MSSPRSATDAVVTLGVASEPYSTYFETDWRPVHTAEELRAVRSDADNTWLVMAFPDRTSRDYPDVMRDLGQHFSVAEEFPGTLGDGRVIVYRDNGR